MVMTNIFASLVILNHRCFY